MRSHDRLEPASVLVTVQLLDEKLNRVALTTLRPSAS